MPTQELTYDINELMSVIQYQFSYIIENNPTYYGNVPFYLSDEQQFVKNKNLDPNAIYIVVKFRSASINFGQINLPFDVTAVAEQNKIDMCRELLIDFATTWNLQQAKKSALESVTSINQQVYTSPTIISNFNEIQAGYRSLFYLSGAFLISKNIIKGKLEFKYSNAQGAQPEQVEFLNYSSDCSLQLDTQAFYQTQNFTKSLSRIATRSFSLTLYLTNSELCKRVMQIKYKKIDIDTPFLFKFSAINPSDESELGDTDFIEYKLVSMHEQKNIGELPYISLTFTN